MMNWQHLDITVQGLQQHYQNKDFSPEQLLIQLLAQCKRFDHKNIWIHRLSWQQLKPYCDKLQQCAPEELPLYGVPFAIKDNIDVAGVPTTAACPEFSYLPRESAFVVKQLIAAGAIPLGKTNLDQFATGLVGTRSPEPWGPCSNAFDDAFISGGSSSGSAVAVSLGLVSFALGSDTAGSGRVPASLNNLVGLKPTRGLLSNSGLVPACRSLDCMSIFGLTAVDAAKVLEQVTVYDAADSYARPNTYSNSGRLQGVGKGSLRLGVPADCDLEFFGDKQCEALFRSNIEQWQALGAELVEIDLKPFLDAARLLYEGPWLAERYIACRDILHNHAGALHPVVRGIIEPGAMGSATDAFEAQYRLTELKRKADAELANVDLLITPTQGCQYRIDEVLADPVVLNSRLGYYTNFVNLLDYAAIAVPGGFTQRGVPSGFTLIADKFHDQQLLAWAAYWQQHTDTSLGCTDLPYSAPDLPAYIVPDTIDLVVCGAHLDGLPLNWQLRERGGYLIEKTSSAPCYRLYALPDGKRPGLSRDSSTGTSIEVEVWRLPAAELGSFVAAIAAPLGIGKIQLADGRWESGFICEAYGLEQATDITEHLGWRAYLEA